MPTEKGNGLQTIKMSEYLNNHYEVELFYPKRSNKIIANILFYYDCKKNSRLHQLIVMILNIEIIFLNNIINNYNYKIHVFFLYFLKILKEIKNRNYDYIFVRDYYLLYLFYKFNYNLKHIIFEIHSLPKGKLFSNIIKNVFCLIFINNKTYEKYKKIINTKKIVLQDAAEVRNIVYNDRIENKFKFKNYINLAYIGKVQTNGYNKISFFIESIYKYFQENKSKIRLIIIGDDIKNFDPSSRVYCNQLIKQNKLKFINHVKYRNLNKIYSFIDVACIPYQKNIQTQYASPLKIFEYINFHKPILTSDIGDTLNILNFEEAYIYQENNINSLFKNLRDIENNFPNNFKIYNSKLAQEFSWEKRCSLLFNCLENS